MAPARGGAEQPDPRPAPRFAAREELGSEIVLVSADEAGELVLVALRTPPYNLVLAGAGEERMAWLAEQLAGRSFDPPLPGVLGANAEAEAFAMRWGALHGIEPRCGRRQRIYECLAVRPAERTDGTLRRAGEGDVEFVTGCIDGFQRDAEVLPAAYVDPRKQAERRIATGEVFLWVHASRPVSIAALTGSTPTGARVSLVFTPPELRRRGFASALVAALTEHAYANGLERTFLYTDLANPTSNHIYQEIGYEPVCDCTEWFF